MDGILIEINTIEDVMKVKVELDREFNMKDLGIASNIFGIGIRRDKKNSRFCLSQETYQKKILNKFGMSNSKSIVTLVNPQFKLSMTQSPSAEVERSYMNSIIYASIVGIRKILGRHIVKL